MFRSKDIQCRPLKLLLSCEVGPKRFFGPPICRGKGIPQILDMRFQFAVTCEHVADFGLVPFSELGSRLGGEKGRKIQSVVKHKSTDTYVGRPNNMKQTQLWLSYDRETAQRMLHDINGVGHFEAKFQVERLRFVPLSMDR